MPIPGELLRAHDAGLACSILMRYLGMETKLFTA